MTKQVTLENTLAGGFGLPTGQIVPGAGSLIVEPEIWDASKDHPVVKARVDAGTLIVDGKGKKSTEQTADVAALQARIAELEGQVKDRDDELAKLKKPASDQPKTAAEVLAMATAEGVHFKTFEAEAKKLMGDKTPSGKDEIVKALEELATKP